MRSCALAAAWLLLLAVGCGDDSSTNPPPAEKATITVDPNPDSLDAPWTLTGPDSFSASDSGDSTLTDREAGDHSIAWGAVAGWIPPAGETAALAVGGSLTFTGTYIEQVALPGNFIQIEAGDFLMGSPSRAAFSACGT